jgi:hypothetical protein
MNDRLEQTLKRQCATAGGKLDGGYSLSDPRKVVEGLDVLDKINGEYGEGAPNGGGPNQSRIQSEGNAYLKKSFPNLDYIKSASVLK